MGNGAEVHELLDGLVGGAIFADGDAVVGEDENHLEIGDGGQAHRRPHVVREDQEGRCEGDGAAVGRDAVLAVKEDW
mgnify:CR=1 FL=1